MRWLSVACVCVVVVHLASSYPLQDSSSLSKQETLSSVEATLGHPTSEHSERDKRTIGVLRRIFPELSKIIDDKIQQLTSVIFRVVGRFVLGAGGLGGGGGGGGAGGGGNGGSGDGGSRRISITLPTYPPDEDEEEETEEPAASPTTEENTATDSNAIEDDSGSSSRRRREAEEPLEAAESEKKEVRVVPDGNDLKAASTGDAEDAEEAESSNEEITDDAESAASGEQGTRNKRLGVLGNLFGGSSGGGSGGSGGSGGGSGNFLFDIIRRTADGAARAAGTVYRMVAGTDGDDLLAYTDNNAVLPPLEMAVAAATSPTVATATSPAKPPPPAAPAKPTLVAGSGATEQQDESANAPVAPATGDQAAAAAPTDDGYQAGIPGPITRLFVIANRGIANLIQDLILRLAQTSERIVNFKARLITAII